MSPCPQALNAAQYPRLEGSRWPGYGQVLSRQAKGQAWAASALRMAVGPQAWALATGTGQLMEEAGPHPALTLVHSLFQG